MSRLIIVLIIIILLYFIGFGNVRDGFCNTGDKCLQITQKFCKCLRIMPEVSEPTEITIPQNQYVDFKAENLDHYYQYFNPIEGDYPLAPNTNANYDKKLNVGLYNKII